MITTYPTTTMPEPVDLSYTLKKWYQLDSADLGMTVIILLPFAVAITLASPVWLVAWAYGRVRYGKVVSTNPMPEGDGETLE